MSDPTPVLLPDPTLAREQDLDALAGLLPFDARERWPPSSLTGGRSHPQAPRPLRHGRNTLRALASDLGYLEAWCSRRHWPSLPWPATEA